MQHNRNDLSGQQFGKLTVVGIAPSREYKNGWKAAMWHCHCACGSEKDVRAMDLRRGSTTSCGCTQRDLARKKATVHGKAGTPEHHLWAAARDRHRRRGIPFDLKLEDIIIPQMCPVLGIPLIAGTDKFQDASPSIDRLDPTKGYTSDNITVMSFRANALKRDATLDELKAILRYMQEGPPMEALVKAVTLVPQIPLAPPEDLTGNLVGCRFGKLVVEHQNNRMCACSCDCGGQFTTYASQLQIRRSCGTCTPPRSHKHGESSTGRGTDRYQLWRGAKLRAGQKGLLFDIEVQGITIPEICPVLGIPLKANVGGKTGAPGSPSLDRIHPEKGYAVGNVAVISQRANFLKSDATLQEWSKLVAWATKSLKEIR